MNKNKSSCSAQWRGTTIKIIILVRMIMTFKNIMSSMIMMTRWLEYVALPSAVVDFSHASAHSNAHTLETRKILSKLYCPQLFFCFVYNSCRFFIRLLIYKRPPPPAIAHRTNERPTCFLIMQILQTAKKKNKNFATNAPLAQRCRSCRLTSN